MSEKTVRLIFKNTSLQFPDVYLLMYADPLTPAIHCFRFTQNSAGNYTRFFHEMIGQIREKIIPVELSAPWMTDRL
jgi:hypothetical protein